MEETIDVNSAIDIAIAAIRRGSNYTDVETVSSFIILLDAIIESPNEIFSLNNPLKLSIVLTTLVTSGFPEKHPYYYNYNTGKIACAVGFYCFMKQMKATLPAPNLPTIIVLLHDGRHYMADLFEESMNSNVRSPYNIFDILDSYEASSKKYAIVKGLEFLMHKTYNEYGLYDETLTEWKSDLNSEIDRIKNVAETENFFDYAKMLYEYLDKKFKSKEPFVFNE